jgi:hypothetical protein
MLSYAGMIRIRFKGSDLSPADEEDRPALAARREAPLADIDVRAESLWTQPIAARAQSSGSPVQKRKTYCSPLMLTSRSAPRERA